MSTREVIHSTERAEKKLMNWQQQRQLLGQHTRWYTPPSPGNPVHLECHLVPPSHSSKLQNCPFLLSQPCLSLMWYQVTGGYLMTSLLLYLKCYVTSKKHMAQSFIKRFSWIRILGYILVHTYKNHPLTHVKLDKKYITRLFGMVFNGKLHHSLLHVLHEYISSGTHICPHPLVIGNVTVQMSTENWLHKHNDIFFRCCLPCTSTFAILSDLKHGVK